MLQVNPKNRPNTDQILEHPAFRKFNQEQGVITNRKGEKIKPD